MGVGLNVQNRLKAEIHVNMPQRPDQVEQREGRIVRIGNMYDQVEIYRLITKPRDVNAPKPTISSERSFWSASRRFSRSSSWAGSSAGTWRTSPATCA